ncbi:MAG: hypothetical protein AABX71_01485 [Nanoarchaeota archaeon]
MALEVQVLTGRKGSNPGGICNIIVNPYRIIPCYVKYCPGSHLPRGSNLGARNQPVYEAVTNELVRRVGLATPRTHVLIDTDKDVRFIKLDGAREGLGEGRRYYFVSELVTTKQSKNQELLKEVRDREEPYLDILGICDVFNISNNYFFYEDKTGKIVYIDLGCSFVRAKEGWIEIKNRDRREMGSRDNLKRARKELANYSIVPAQGGSPISLFSLVEDIPNIELSTLNPDKRMAVTGVLSPAEITEIQTILTVEIDRGLKKYRRNPHIIIRN